MKKLALLIGAAIVFAPPAQADDMSFLVAIDEAGIYYESPFNMIDLGEAVCNALRVDASMHDIAKMVINHGYTPIESGFIASTAVIHICPDQELG